MDIAALLAAGRRNAENTAAGFDPDSLAAVTTDRRVELPAGWLSVSRIDATGVLTLVVDHKTALFVDGDVRIAGRSFAL